MRGYAARRSVNWKPYAGAAARVIGRAARAYLRRKRKGYAGRLSRGPPRKKLFSRTRIGEQVSSTNSKSFLAANEVAIVRNNNTLYTLDLTAFAQGTAMNQRQRQHVNMRGFKICMEVKNTTTNTPIYFNQAVIAPKNTTLGIDTQNFFRQSSDVRAVSFSNALSGLEFHCLPINTDDYTVLKHRRYVLNTGNQPGSWNKQGGSSWINTDWYIPLKRQTRYNNSESTTATDGRVFHVFWFAFWNQATGVAPGACAGTSIRVVTYFREPKH